ncbi:MAG: glycosyltransferase family 2 protein, partial [Bacteroidales bacterium]|nr:glycosyltransferase family 2 protein [Bacteroidales bacterium]
MPNLSIITVNYNGLEFTLELLSSIKKHLANYRYECLVLDNGSRENEAISLQKAFPEYSIFRSERNLGFAGGNNLCLTRARGRYLYFLNNDTLLSDNTAIKLIDYMDRHPEIGACSPKILFYQPEGVLQFSGITAMSRVTLRNKGLGYLKADLGQFDNPQPTHYLHGAAMMVSKTALAKVGPLPEEYFLYYEETDWSEAFKRH